MLRLQGVDVRPAHRGEFRVLIAAQSAGPGQLRGYLIADLLRRYAERTGLAPTVIDLLPAREAALRADCDRLNIHPPGHTMPEPFDAGELTGQFPDGIREPVFDVGVRALGAPGAPGAPGAALATVERLAGHWVEVAGTADGRTPDEEPLRVDEEPLSVRMKLMRTGYREELTADSSFLRGDDPPAPPGGHDPADGELAWWRQLVAKWARSPSGAMSRRHADAITAAFAGDLDTPAALRELAGLAVDESVPDGVKFETFAAADMLLGLDLARDVGRLTNRW